MGTSLLIIARGQQDVTVAYFVFTKNIFCIKSPLERPYFPPFACCP
jgi:hypothetical protein